MQEETGLWRSLGDIVAFSAINLVLILFSLIASFVLEETTFHVCLFSLLILAFLSPEWRIRKVITQQATERWRSLGMIAAISIVHLLLHDLCTIAPNLWVPLHTDNIYAVAEVRMWWFFTQILAFPLGWMRDLRTPHFNPLLALVPNSVLWGTTLYFACRTVHRYCCGRSKNSIQRPTNPSSQDRATLRTFSSHA